MITRVLRAFSWLTGWGRSEEESPLLVEGDVLEVKPATAPVQAPPIAPELVAALVSRERRIEETSSRTIPFDLLQLACAYQFQASSPTPNDPLDFIGFIGAASTGKSTWFNQFVDRGRLVIEDPEPHATQGTVVYLHADHARTLRSLQDPDATGYGIFGRARVVDLSGRPTDGGEDPAEDPQLSGATGRLTLLLHDDPSWRNLALVDLADTSTSEALDTDQTALFLPWLDVALLIDVPDTVQREATLEWSQRAQVLGARAIGLLNVWEPDKQVTREDALRVYGAAGCQQAEILPFVDAEGGHRPVVRKVLQLIRSEIPDSRRAHLAACLSRRAALFKDELTDREEAAERWEKSLAAAFRLARQSTLYAQPLRPEWLLDEKERGLVRRHGLARYRPSLLLKEGFEWTARTRVGQTVLTGLGLGGENPEPADSITALKSAGTLWMEQAEVAVRRAFEQSLSHHPVSRSLLGPKFGSSQLKALSSEERNITSLDLVNQLEEARLRLLELVGEVKSKDDESGWDRSLTLTFVTLSIAADVALPGLGQSTIALIPELIGAASDPLKSVKADLQRKLRRPLDSYLAKLGSHYGRQVNHLLDRDPELLEIIRRTTI